MNKMTALTYRPSEKFRATFERYFELGKPRLEYFQDRESGVLDSEFAREIGAHLMANPDEFEVFCDYQRELTPDESASVERIHERFEQLHAQRLRQNRAEFWDQLDQALKALFVPQGQFGVRLSGGSTAIDPFIGSFADQLKLTGYVRDEAASGDDVIRQYGADVASLLAEIAKFFPTEYGVQPFDAAWQAAVRKVLEIRSAHAPNPEKLKFAAEEIVGLANRIAETFSDAEFKSGEPTYEAYGRIRAFGLELGQIRLEGPDLNPLR